MVGLVTDAAWKRVKEKNYEIWEGTLESNPGPSVYQVNALPVELFARFVIIMERNYYNGKQALVV